MAALCIYGVKACQETKCRKQSSFHVIGRVGVAVAFSSFDIIAVLPIIII